MISLLTGLLSDHPNCSRRKAILLATRGKNRSNIDPPRPAQDIQRSLLSRSAKVTSIDYSSFHLRGEPDLNIFKVFSMTTKLSMQIGGWTFKRGPAEVVFQSVKRFDEKF